MKNILVFQGPDYHPAEKRIALTIEKYIPKETVETAVSRYYASNTSTSMPPIAFWKQINMIAASPIFGAAHQVVVVYDFETLTPLEKIKDVVQNCRNQCFLFLLSHNLKCLAPNLKSFFQKSPNVECILEKFPKRNTLRSRLQTFAKTEGLLFPEPTLQFLIDNFAKYPEYLEQELQKITLFFSDIAPTSRKLIKSLKKIDVKELSDILTPPQEINIFQVQDALFYKKKKDAFINLKRFFYQGEGGELIHLLFALLRQTQILLGYLSLKEKKNPQELFKILQLRFDFQQKNLINQARHTSKTPLLILLEGLLLVEKILKSDHNVVLKIHSKSINGMAKAVLEKYMIRFLNA